MNRFWRYFIPYQLWRFVLLNTKMYLVAKGIVGPHARAHAHVMAPPETTHGPA